MKSIVCILFVLCGLYTNAQTLDARKYTFGSGEGSASVCKQVGGVKIVGKTDLFEGDTLRLQAEVACLEGVTYNVNWFRQDGTNLSKVSENYEVQGVTQAHAGGYYCVVEDQLTGQQTRSDVVTVSILPNGLSISKVSLTEVRLELCEGETNESLSVADITFNTERCSDAVKQKIINKEYTVSYTWKRNGNIVGTGEKMSFSSITLAEAGQYICEVEVQVGTAGNNSNVAGTSGVCDVAVASAPRLSVFPGETATVIFGHSTELKVSGAQRYEWSTGSRDSVLAVSPHVETVYRVTGYNGGKCSASKEITVDVIRLELNLGGDRVIFKGETLEMDIQTNADSVLWYKDRDRMMVARMAAPMPAAMRAARASGELVGKNTPVQLSPDVTTTYRLEVYFQGTMSTVPFTVTVKDGYAGGEGDGYAQNCLPPRIIAQSGPKDEAGCELQDVELFVQPEGTELQLTWEIFDRSAGKFVDYAGAGNVTGLGLNRLTFKGFEGANNGIYRCRVSNACGEVVSDTFALNNKRAPMIIGRLNDDQTLCQDEGKTARLGIRVEPAKNITYEWFKADSVGNFQQLSDYTGNYMELVLMPSSDGIYKVRTSNECGIDSSQINLSVVTPPIITSFSDKVYVCEGGDTELYVEVDGKGSFEYTLVEYDKYDYLQEIDRKSGSPLVVLNNVTENRIFRWIVENQGKKCGSKQSELISVSVDRPLSFYENIPQGWDTLVCRGDKFIKFVSVNQLQSSSPLKYTWLKDNAELPGQTTNVLIFDSLPADAGGEYKVRVQNKCPFIESNPFTLRVNEVPKVLSSPDVDRTYCEGKALHLRVVASNEYKVDSIRWYLNDYKLIDERNHVKGAGTTDLTADTMDNGHAGVYVARLYNICGFSESTPATVNLLQKAVFDFKLENYDTLLCTPEYLEVTATGPDLRYKWLYNGKPILDEFGREVASSITNALKMSDVPGWDKSGNYNCLVQNSCGDELSKANLTFSVTAPFNLGGENVYCEGGDGVTLRLEGSLPHVIYELHEVGQDTALQTLYGDDVKRGDTLYFPYVKAGNYQVIALDTMQCRTVMPNEVTVQEDPWPRKFISSVARPVCSEGGNGDIALSGSEKYIEYFLCKRDENDPQGRWDTLQRIYPGTNKALLMKNITQGIYKVVARNPVSFCEVGMDEILDLRPHKLPSVGKLSVVDMNDIHCIGTKSDVKLMYDHFQPGYTYTLKRNGVLTDKVKKYYPAVFEEVEVGQYCVTITDTAGCSFDVGNVRVFGQQAPRIVNLNGQGGIFCPESASPRFIELDNTQAGVVYSLYRDWSEVNTVHILDTMSRYGGAMTLEVPTKEGTYYVMATDTTPKHCSVRMNGEVTLKASRFDLNLPGGGVVKVFDESQQTLTVSAHDAVGKVDYYWRPIENLASNNNNSPSVTTIPVTEPLLYIVTGTDEMGCSVERDVKVEPYGCAFKGAILDSEGNVAENEQVCRGDAIYLKSRFQCGGGLTAYYLHYRSEYRTYVNSVYETVGYWVNVPYYTTRFFPYITSYEWYDDNGRIASGDEVSSIHYVKKESGWVYCKMTNGPRHYGRVTGTGYHHLSWDPVQTRTYKVWVELQQSPKIFHVEDPGLREVVLNAEELIQLNQSEHVVSYHLEYNGGDGFKEVKDTEMDGNGGNLDFYISGDRMQWGYYRVVGEYQNEGELGLKCVREMNGRVEIRRRGFQERLEIERPMCIGDSTADLRITTSSKDVIYHICREEGNNRWDTLSTWYRGTGEAIIIKDVPKGVYHAVASVDYVDNVLDGEVEVKEEPLPDIVDFRFMDNDSINCWGENPRVIIRMDDYQLGYTYSLIKNGEDLNEERRTSPVMWLGVLDGEYQVKITNEAGCSVLSPKHTVEEVTPPVIQRLIGDERPFCDPREEGERILTLGASEEGVLYSFRWRSDEEVFKDTLGNGGQIKLSVPLVDREYYVVATDTLTGCAREMDNDVYIQLSPLAVTADKAIVTTTCGTPAQLRITVKGATPPLKIEWNNEEFLAAGQKNEQNPYTIPLLDQSKRFRVTVTDSLGCIRETEVLAECVPEEEIPPRPEPGDSEDLPDGTGGPLLAWIHDGACISAVGDTVYATEGASLGFCAYATGGLGKYSFRWSDSYGLLSDARSFKGWRPSESGYLYLEIMTPDGQVATDRVWIAYNGDELLPPMPPDFPYVPCPVAPDKPKPLQIDIMDGYCNEELDTLVLCQGKIMSLCANAVGGCGNYSVRWFDDVRTLGIGRGLRYAKAESGYVYLEITSDGDNQTALDTIWISVGKTPLRHRIADGGLRCILPEDYVEVTVDGSESDAVYQLEHSLTNLAFEPVQTKNGTDGALTFYMDDAAYGFYRVTASFPGELGCSSVMFDEIEVRRSPRAFNISGGWEYCEGSPIEGTVWVDTTEVAAEYSLYRGNTKVETLDGTDDSLGFTGYYTAGRYYVEARIGQCVTDMNGEVEVKVVPRPQLGTITPSGIVCQTSGPWEIGISASQPGHRYYLKRELYNTEMERWGDDSVRGVAPGGLTFGTYQEEGDYYVVAVHEEKGCEFAFEGPKIRYSEPRPIRWSVDKCITERTVVDEEEHMRVKYDTVYRYTKNGREVWVYRDTVRWTTQTSHRVWDKREITLIDVDTLLNYWLSYNGGTPGLVNIYPGNVVLEDMPNGSYCITAEDPETSCRTEELCDFMSTMVTGYVDDTLFTCGGDVEIPVHDADPDAEYHLCFDWDEYGEMPLETCRYPNAVFRPGALDPGVYRFIKKKLPDPAYPNDVCEEHHIFEIVTGNPPFAVKVIPDLQGDDLYRMCPWDVCEIGLEEMEAGVTYSLEFTANGETKTLSRLDQETNRKVVAWDTVWDMNYREVQINGGPGWTLMADSTMRLVPARYEDVTSFGKYSAEGWYEVVADNGCRRSISRFGIIHTDPPQQRQVYGDEKCVHGLTDSIRIFLSQRDQHISYYLYLEDQKVDSILYTAPDSVTSFNYQYAIGCYYVWAETNSPTCRTKLDRTVCMNYPPSKYSLELAGQTKVLCREADSIPIYMMHTDIGVHYQVEWNNRKIGQPVEGTGDYLLIGSAREPGDYTVVAWVGNCEERMTGILTVRPGKAPEILLPDTMRYCQGAGGIEVEMPAPTSDTLRYSLWNSKTNELLEQRDGDPFGGAFTFSGKHMLDSIWVSVEDLRGGCSDMKTVRLIEDTLPLQFRLMNENNGFLCPDSKTNMYVDGSEAGVEYRLYKLESGQLMGTGTGVNGREVKLADVGDVASYHAVAVLLKNESCQTPMLDTIELKPAPEIQEYELETVNKYYCYVADPSGKVALPSSQVGIRYELLKDGVSLGRAFIGDGNPLEWNSLEGKSCDSINTVDEFPDEMGWSDGRRYTVQAIDPATGCKRMMQGEGLIIMEKDPRLISFYPTIEQNVCVGEPLSANVPVALGCNLTYVLEKDGAEIYRGEQPVYDIAAMTDADYGVYHWVVTNSCGSDHTADEFLVSPRDEVKLKNKMKNASFCGKGEGEKVTLVSGFENALYTEWYKLGDETVLSTAQILVLNSKEEIGTYVCKAWNECSKDRPLTDTVEVTFGTPQLNIQLRRDTLCVGEEIIYGVETDATVRWFKGDKDLGRTGRRLVLNNVVRSDEGVYSISAKNLCGETFVDVGMLAVDDTIHITDVSQDVVLCLGYSTNLFIKADTNTPNNRITYRWYHDKDLISTNENCPVGPFRDRLQQSYTVWYNNACTDEQKQNYHTVQIDIPQPITYDVPRTLIQFCANCIDDTVLRLNTDPGMLAKYEWYYRANEQDTMRTLQESKADTLSIKMCTRNSGFYYCHIRNACDQKTVPTSWIKIDSIPEILSEWPSVDTICKAAPHTIVLKTTGGNMTYRLHILYPDGKYWVEEASYTTYESEYKFKIPNVADNWDGAKLWCDVLNSCDTLTTDTMTLRIKPLPTLDITPLNGVACGSDGIDMILTLNGGVAPWEYGYRLNGSEELHKEIDIMQFTDTLHVDSSGVYEFVYMQDGNGCSIPEFYTKAIMTVPTLSTIDLVCDQTMVCRRDTVKLGVKITGGEGPWRFKLHEYEKYLGSNKTTTDYLIYSRDTVLDLVYLQLGHYIYNVEPGSFFDDYNAMGCEGNIGSKAEVEIQSGGIINWNILKDQDRTVGGCVQTIDLFKMYDPDNKDGKFYVTGADGKAKEISLGAWVSPEPGCYDVEYVYIADNGCPASLSPATQQLCVDSLPQADLHASEHDICIGQGTARMYFDLKGTAPFTFNFTVYRYDFDGKLLGRPTYVLNKESKDGNYSVAASAADSLHMYVHELTYLRDAHGCPWANKSPLRDTVLYHRPPSFELAVGYHDVWYPNGGEIYIQQGDSVSVACRLTQDTLAVPWRVSWENLDIHETGSVDLQHARDTFKFGDAGFYDVRAQNAFYCQSMFGSTMNLVMLDTGYVTVSKLYLEGPLVASSSQMKSSIKDYLPTYGKALPNVSKAIIDWVYVELWHSLDDVGPASIDTCLLLADGTLVDRDGKQALAVPGVVPVDGRDLRFHLVFRHRNHLPIATEPIAFGATSNQATNIDISKGDVVYVGSENPNLATSNALGLHMSQVKLGNGTTVWAMSAGEVNENQTVTVFDPNVIAKEMMATGGTMTYELLLYDLNFNGKIEWGDSNSSAVSRLDWEKAYRNRNKFTEAPVPLE